jgi:glutamine amidotransferase
VKTVLIDYGAGNLHSVHKALLAAGLETVRSDSPQEAAQADVLVLPGQGHFRQVMEAFLSSGFEPVVREHIAQEKPFLGICVGLQLLMASSEEAPGVAGLGVLPGTVKRFRDPNVSVPQMGWNQFFSYGNPALLEGLPEGAFVYFCNSYYIEFMDESVPGAITEYGSTRFKSVISKGNLHATQFHPEKSQKVGLSILRNFKTLAERAVAGA